MSTLNVDKVDPSTGTALEIGTSGDTITVPSGATFVVAGTTEITGTNNVQRPPNAQSLIINGDMGIWQRGTGTVTTTGAYVGVDRFKISEDTDGSFSTERHTMSNAEKTTTGFDYALQADCTGTDASIGASQTAEISQTIEGQNCMVLQYGTSNAKDITLSFWVKSSKTGTYTAAIRKRDVTKYDCPQEYTISVADTWEKKVIHISPTAGSTSFITAAAGAISNDNGAGLGIQFNLAMGSNNDGTTNTWEAANKPSTSNQVNWMDSTSNDFYLTGVQLEVGEFTSSTLPPFQRESYGDNLLRCMRYYNIFGNAASKPLGLAAFSSATAAYAGPLAYPVEMRSSPTITITGGSGGVEATAGFAINHSASNDWFQTFSSSSTSTKECQLYVDADISATDGDAGRCKTGNIEFGKVEASAEL